MDRKIQQLRNKIAQDPYDINAVRALHRLLERVDTPEYVWVITQYPIENPERYGILINVFDNEADLIEGLAETLESEFNFWKSLHYGEVFDHDLEFIKRKENEAAFHLEKGDYHAAAAVADQVTWRYKITKQKINSADYTDSVDIYGEE